MRYASLDTVALPLIFGTSFVVGLSGALAPGPLTTVNLVESARRGFAVAPLLSLGHGLVELAIVVALALGLSRFLQHSLVTGAVGLAGGAVLLWMGLGLVRSFFTREALRPRGVSRELAANSSVLTGAVLSIANPYLVLWWATIGSAYVLWSLQQGPLGLSAFYGGHILADLSWLSLLAFLVTRGRRLAGEGFLRWLFLACGLFLLALSAYFVIFGLGALARQLG